ncbi:MAG TPA: glycosyltransferase [Ottowia sp.]|uniref:glycosyltransferase n=1 Tax=Ottowia sp. TaxID=1898956 RepID=UPI002CF4434B|nr:glycosyltransferase [Ottowia sp.]HMN19844.1 glycosyltransferase [Ottowia sp.]
MKTLFVLPNMKMGGVGQITNALMRGFAMQDDDCYLALRHARGELLEDTRKVATVYELAPVGLHQFVPALTRLLRRLKPDCIITAFADVGVMTWLAMRLARSHARWVHGVHNTHARIIARPGMRGGFRHVCDNRAAAFCYRHADRVVAVSDGVRSEVIAMVPSAASRTVTIYNPVVPDTELQLIDKPWPVVERPIRLVALGRLVRQKGFDILIEAMKAVAGDWQLDIWGAGPDGPALQRDIDDARLSDRIHLRGYTNRPYEVLREADVYVLSSRHEGLPTTLIEAMACQCQLVATDCPHGPREILCAGALGKLVPPGESESLALAIRHVLADSARIPKITLLARARDFSATTAVEHWRGVLHTDWMN